MKTFVIDESFASDIVKHEQFFAAILRYLILNASNSGTRQLKIFNICIKVTYKLYIYLWNHSNETFIQQGQKLKIKLPSLIFCVIIVNAVTSIISKNGLILASCFWDICVRNFRKLSSITGVILSFIASQKSFSGILQDKIRSGNDDKISFIWSTNHCLVNKSFHVLNTNWISLNILASNYKFNFLFKH